MAHARLGPSNHRWPHCPGSVREEARFPDIPGEAAIDGTGSHLLLEMCLQNNVPAIQYDQQIIGANHPEHPSGWLVNPDRIERVQMCLNYVQRRVNELYQLFPGCTVTVLSETKSDPGAMFGRDDWWGTVDITILARDKMTGELFFLEVVDYKDGRGWVEVADNTQLISYLAGKMRPYIASGPQLVSPLKPGNVPNCRMTIVQPKTSPVIRYVCSTRYEDNFSAFTVVEAAEKLAWAAQCTDFPDAPLIPGKWCQWCKANPKRGGDCMAQVNESVDTVSSLDSSNQLIATDKSIFEFIGSSFSKIKELSDTQLADLADARDGVMAGFDEVFKEIEARIDQGKHVPGYEYGVGRGSNVWNDTPENIEKMLKKYKFKKDDIYPPSLISPAQVLKSPLLDAKQKEKIEKEFITYKAGKQTLKKVARQPVKLTAELMFAGINPQPKTETISFM